MVYWPIGALTTLTWRFDKMRRAAVRGKRFMGKGQRILRIIGGYTLIVIGVPLLVLPGPGAPAILLGLALLGAEYVWARRLLDRVKKQGARLRSAIPLLK